jgi:hypothetical protein
MAARDDLALSIVEALQDDDEAGYVDATYLDEVCVDGWYNLRIVADKLIAQGWTRGDPS